MRVLVVFDEWIDRRAFAAVPRNLDCATILPLRSDLSKQAALREVLRSLGVKDVRVEDSARTVGSCVEELREHLAESCARLGEVQVQGRSVREWFLLPQLGMSTWWFGLLAERNPLKTNVFLRLAQVRAVDRVLLRDGCDLCVVSTRDASLAASLRALLAARRVRGVFLSTSGPWSFWPEVRQWLTFSGVVWHSAKALWVFTRLASRKAWIWWRLGTAKRHSSTGDVSLFVTYYPSMEREAAEQGVFRNKFSPFLQDELSASKQTVIWVLVFTPLEGLTFWDGVEFAKRFICNGERMLFLEEALHWSDFTELCRSGCAASLLLGGPRVRACGSWRRASPTSERCSIHCFKNCGGVPFGEARR